MVGSTDVPNHTIHVSVSRRSKDHNPTLPMLVLHSPIGAKTLLGKRYFTMWRHPLLRDSFPRGTTSTCDCAYRSHCCRSRRRSRLLGHASELSPAHCCFVLAVHEAWKPWLSSDKKNVATLRILGDRLGNGSRPLASNVRRKACA